MTRARTFIAVTLVAVLAIFALGWLLLVSPKRSKADEVRASTRTKLADIAALENKIQQVKAQALGLPAVQARLAAIDQRLPTEPALPSLIRALSDAAAASGARLITLAPGAPAPFAGAGQAATAVQPGQAAVAAGGLASIGVTMTIEGTYLEISEFLTRLESLQRSMLVQNIALAPIAAAAGSINAGLVGATIAGSVFMSAPVDPAAAAAAAQPSGAASPPAEEG